MCNACMENGGLIYWTHKSHMRDGNALTRSISLSASAIVWCFLLLLFLFISFFSLGPLFSASHWKLKHIFLTHCFALTHFSIALPIFIYCTICVHFIVANKTSFLLVATADATIAAYSHFFFFHFSVNTFFSVYSELHCEQLMVQWVEKRNSFVMCRLCSILPCIGCLYCVYVRVLSSFIWFVITFLFLSLNEQQYFCTGNFSAVKFCCNYKLISMIYFAILFVFSFKHCFFFLCSKCRKKNLFHQSNWIWHGRTIEVTCCW